MLQLPPDSSIVSRTEETAASTSTSAKNRSGDKYYYQTRTSDNLEDAMHLTKEEQIWKIKTKSDRAIYYRCNLQK